jgi:DNA-directed RNA polymerase beta' subunit
MTGHESLFCHTMDASQIQFRCSVCGHIWTRLYRGVGKIEWAEPGKQSPGMPVPGRRLF